MIKKTILYIQLFCFSLLLVAGEENPVIAKRDTELWEGVAIDFKLAKRLKGNVAGQLRYNNNVTSLKANLSEIGIRYRLNKWLALRINYRLTNRARDIRHRFDINGQLRLKKHSFQVSLRLRLQKEFIKEVETGMVFRSRLRATFHRNKKICPFLGGELFLGAGDDPENRRQYRLSLGTIWQAQKKLGFTLYYHHQRELVPEQPEIRHIIGLQLDYSL